MKIALLIFGLVSIGGFLAFQKSSTVKNTNSAIGIWYAESAKHPTLPQSTMEHIFKYDGKHLIMFLFCKKDWMWRTKDDYYKLKTKWEGDKLMYLPPFGPWTELTSFDGERFVRKKLDGWNSLPPYNRISEEEVPEFHKAIIKKGRNLHDYSIKAIDQPAWRKNTGK